MIQWLTPAPEIYNIIMDVILLAAAVIGRWSAQSHRYEGKIPKIILFISCGVWTKKVTAVGRIVRTKKLEK